MVPTASPCRPVHTCPLAASALGLAACEHTSQSWACRAVVQTICVFLTLPCLPQMAASPSSDSLKCFPSSYEGNFIVLSGVQGLLLVFSWCSVRIVASTDVFLMHPCRDELHVLLLLRHLESPFSLSSFF